MKHESKKECLNDGEQSTKLVYKLADMLEGISPEMLQPEIPCPEIGEEILEWHE